MIPARFHFRTEEGQRGQGLVELAIVLPIIIALFVSTAELGLIYGKINSIGYASREGARTGSALAHGGATDCAVDGWDPAEVDKAIVSSVQRILTSPDSGIDLKRVEQIRIFKATSSGAETSSVNTWVEGQGPRVDSYSLPDGTPVEVHLSFRESLVNWPACFRDNGDNPDSIGVTVNYRYDYVTPLPILVDALTNGRLSLTLSETTVMALNPTVETS